MEGRPYQGKREERPEEAEGLFREESEDILPEEAIESLVDSYIELKEAVGEAEIADLWCKLQPQYESLWQIEGNTIRWVRLQKYHYSEHMELGLCYIGETLAESLNGVLKRASIAVNHLLPLGEGTDRYRAQLDFVASRGGTEAWEDGLRRGVGEIIAGALPTRIVLLIPELEQGTERAPLASPYEAYITVAEGKAILDFPHPVQPQRVEIQLFDDALLGERDDAQGGRWVFNIGDKADLYDLTFRPLVLEFSPLPESIPSYNYTWPHAEGLELIEGLARGSDSP